MKPVLTLVIGLSGITYSIIIGLYSQSNAQVTSTASVYQRAFDDFFVFLKMGVSVIAWGLFMSTAGITTPLVATVFILSELVFVMKESITLFLFHWYDMPTISLNVSPESQGNQTPALIEIHAHQDRAWVNLISALLLTGIIAGWCLMPEDVIVGVVSLIALSVVHWKQQQDVSNIEVDLIARLQSLSEESRPWWVERLPQVEPRVQNDLIIPHDARNTERFRDWYHEEASGVGLASQSGIFSRQSNACQAENNSYATSRERSSRQTADYSWLTSVG